MTTSPVYWTQPNEEEFSVKVVKCRKEEEAHHIVVSQQVVKPVGGGQAADRGVLTTSEKQVPFSEVVENGDGVAIVTAEAIEEGSEVTLILDMNWRKSMMRNHTAEHLFVKLLVDQHEELELGRIWVDGIHGSVEVSGCHLSSSDIFSAEKKVQKAIADELEVKTHIVSPEDLDESVRAREGVTSKHDRLRIVEIEGSDRSACSGIHVGNTRDIGVFKIIEYRIDDESSHIEFLTGPSALTHLTSTYNQVLGRRYDYPFEMEQLGAILDKSKSMREDYENTIETLLDAVSKGGDYQEAGKASFRAEYLPGIDVKALKDLSNRIEMPKASLLLLFAATEHEGKKKCNVIVRTNAMPEDASHYAADAVGSLGGKGGGRGEIYTGGFSGQEAPRTLFDSLVKKMKEKLD
jgi:alanyl-tRNA synthetase